LCAFGNQPSAGRTSGITVPDATKLRPDGKDFKKILSGLVLAGGFGIKEPAQTF
jgi:hypothetical protein